MRQGMVKPKLHLLLSKQGQILTQKLYGWTPLHLVAEKGHTETALALIKAGADINAKENIGGTPLHYAA